MVASPGAERTSSTSSKSVLATGEPQRELVLEALHEAAVAPDQATCGAVEESTGVSLAGVRVHRGPAADSAAGALGAHAFTVGDDIVVGSAPRTDTMRHELAHVAHRRASAAVAPRPVDNAAAEKFAEAVAGGARPAIPASSVPAISRQAIDGTSGDRGFVGEQNMSFVGYSMRDGWALLEGSSGAAGHRANAPGFDAVAVRLTGPLEIHLVDNKAFQRAGNVSSATAISTNLASNLDALISRLAATGAHGLDPAQAQRVIGELRMASAALRAGTPLPGTVRLVVTNAYGASTGVTQRLSEMGVQFRDLNAPPPRSTPAPASTPARTSTPASTQAPPRTARLGTPSRPVLGPSGAHGAVQGAALAIHHAQVRHIEAAQMQRAREALSALRPRIDEWRRQGRWVIASIVMNEPRSVDLLRGIFTEPGQIAWFHHVSLRWGHSEAEAQNPPSRWEPAPPRGAGSTLLPELPDTRVLRSYDAVTYAPIETVSSSVEGFDITTVGDREFATRFLMAIVWLTDPGTAAAERTAASFRLRLAPYDLQSPSIRADAAVLLRALRLPSEHRRVIEAALSR